MRRPRDGMAVKAYKQDRHVAGTDHCDACGWRPPAALRLLGVARPIGILEVHHVVPVGCKGKCEPANFVLLCPNHHAIAHRVGKVVRRRGARYARWRGPATPGALLAEIDLIESGEAGYAVHLKAQRRVREADEAQWAEWMKRNDAILGRMDRQVVERPFPDGASTTYYTAAYNGNVK